MLITKLTFGKQVAVPKPGLQAGFTYIFRDPSLSVRRTS